MNTHDIRHFRKTLRRFERMTALQLKDCCCGISMPLCHALIEIDELKQTTTGQLAKNLKLDKSTLSRSIDKLCRLDHVTRIHHPTDRRYSLIVLTEKGKQLCRSIHKASDDFYKNAFDLIPAPKQKEVVENFAILYRALYDCAYYSKMEKQACICDDQFKKE